MAEAWAEVFSICVRVWTAAAKQCRAAVVWMMFAGEAVIVGAEPEIILIDSESFHHAGDERDDLVIGIVGIVLDCRIVVFGENFVAPRIDFQDDVILAHQGVKRAVEPAQIRVMRVVPDAVAGRSDKVVLHFEGVEIDDDDASALPFIGDVKC